MRKECSQLADFDGMIWRVSGKMARISVPGFWR